MKIRFIIVLLGILIPATSFAGFPSFDPMNFGTNISENIQTVLSKIENSQQVITMQKTLAKIGSVKSSISDFINKAKDVANKAKEKFNKYKELGQKYIEKAKAYAEMAKKVVNTAKDIKEQGLGNYLKDNAGELAGGLADKVGLDGSKIGDIADKAASGDFKGIAGDMAGNLADKVGLDGDKISGIADGVMNGDFKGVAGDMAGNLADKVGLDGDKISGIADGVMNGGLDATNNKEIGTIEKTLDANLNKPTIEDSTSLNSKLINVPDAAPSRRVIGGTTNSKLNKTAIGNTSSTPQSLAVNKTPVISSIKGRATSTAAVTKITDKPAVNALDKNVAEMSGKVIEKPVATAKDINNVEATTKIADKPAVTTLDKNVAEVSGKVIEKPVATAKDINNVEATTKITDKPAVTTLDKNVAEVSGKVTEKPVATAKDVVKTEATSQTKKSNANIELNKGVTPKKSEVVTPRRVQFKSSFGYGKMQSKHQLYFASLGGDTKTGSTPEGLLVVPESVSLNCQLNYEDATKDKKMDTCLKSINKISMSEVTEDVTKGMIDDALKDVGNGYVEYLTVTYFEALNAYNESLTFKNNELDPVMTTSTNDIDASWRVAKEMHIVLGERINKLRQLWARVLGMKMYSQHANERFVNEEK